MTDVLALMGRRQGGKGDPCGRVLPQRAGQIRRDAIGGKRVRVALDRDTNRGVAPACRRVALWMPMWNTPAYFINDDR
jgi:hypothetical protein